MFSFLIIALGLCNNVFGQITDYPTVHTKVGTIRGLPATDGDYNKFTGIPYAQVDAKNPFGLHIPKPPFQDVFDAFNDPVKCIQNGVGEMTFDCLQLNIFVPKNASSNNTVPVLMYIHGGGFDAGWSGDFGPKFIVKHDVILINVNYRLGPYGFMCLEIPEVPGNQAIKDVLGAIKWVKENIGAFGGDGDNITIMGESAGGYIVDYLLRFSEPNLYDKAILISGTYSHWTSPINTNYRYAIDMAQRLGFNTSDLLEAVHFLATVDPKNILSAYAASNEGVGICIEKQFPSVPALVTEHPENVAIPNVKTTSILIGYNNAELGVTMSPTFYFDFLFDVTAGALGFKNDAKEVATILRQFYMGDTLKADMKAQDMKEFGHFNSDNIFKHPIERTIAKYVENEASNLYRYMFSYKGGRNWLQSSFNVDVDGAMHSDSLGYLFDLLILAGKPITAEDQLKIDEVTTLWTNFVKYGNPTPEPTELLPINWLKITPTVSNYLEISSELVVGTRPHGDRMAFFDLMYMLADEYK